MTFYVADPHLLEAIQNSARDLGFSHIGSSTIDLTSATPVFKKWLNKGHHGQMHYMEKHGEKRYRPELLVEGTVSILTLRMSYFNPALFPVETLEDPQKAYIAQYALGRDYHKILRKNLKTLGDWLQTEIPQLNYRAFTDSAPVLERALSEQSGLGFIGKNTMLINPQEGSYFFIGALFINGTIAFKYEPTKNHCGHCTKCIDICPTSAIIAPFELDARKCISYLTIEYFGSFPHEYRKAIGNRVFGCDDCQIVCPWNRFAKPLPLPYFAPKSSLDNIQLIELFSWTEVEFLRNTEGSPIRRLGYDRWIRNIAIGLGNAPYSPQITQALQQKKIDDESARDHIKWALNEQQIKRNSNGSLH